MYLLNTYLSKWCVWWLVAVGDLPSVSCTLTQSSCCLHFLGKETRENIMIFGKWKITIRGEQSSWGYQTGNAYTELLQSQVNQPLQEKNPACFSRGKHVGKRSTHAQFNPKSTATCTLFGSLSCVADRSAMSTKVPYGWGSTGSPSRSRRHCWN